MAKQQSQNFTKEKKPNPIVWFFFAILIPVIVAIIITTVVLSIAGVDVGSFAKDTGSKIPVISSFVKTEEEQDVEELEKKYTLVIEEKDEQIVELENLVDDHVHTIEQMTDDALKLEQKLMSNEEDISSDSDVEESDADTIKEMASSYRKMSSKQAALIIEGMDRSIALDILHELSNDVRGKIIEEMSADKAIEITEQYIRQTQ